MAKTGRSVNIEKLLEKLKKKDRSFDFEKSKRYERKRIRLMREAHLLNKLLKAGFTRPQAKVLIDLFATKDEIPWDGRMTGR